MKKNKMLVALLVIFSLVLTGCTMKMEVGIKVDKDEDVTVSTIMAMDNEFIDAMLQMQENSAEEGEDEAVDFSEDEDSLGTEEEAEESEAVVEDNAELEDETVEESTEQKVYTEEERWAYVDQNMVEDEEESYKDFTKTKYEEGEFKGYKYEKKLGKLEEVTEEGEAEEISFDDLTSKSKLFTKKGDVYSLRIDVQDAENLEYYKETEESGVELIAELKLTLPQPAESNNATSVSEDGLTYTWDLKNVSTIEASFKVSKNGGVGILPFVVIAIVVVAVIAVLYLKGKKEKQPEQF